MPPSAARYAWIDLLRGCAVIGMVWTHVANAFLDATQQASPQYHTLSYYHGLIAPTFFWVAGYMRGMSAAKPGSRKPAWPTVKRLLMIWGIGYLLHLPWYELFRGEVSQPVLRILFQSDVLQCLAASSLLLLGIERLSTKHAWQVALGLGLAVLLLTDTMKQVTTGFLPLDAYLSKQHGSLFPLFPWCAFAVAGFLSGCFGAPAWRTAAAGAVAAFVLPWLPGGSGTVGFFAERLGWVVLIAALLANSGTLVNKAPKWLMLAGRESLCLYIAHLLIIYAVPWWRGRTLNQWFGMNQPWPNVLGWFVLVLALAWLVAWLNERRKQRQRVARA